jgi:hypothetical protein
MGANEYHTQDFFHNVPAQFKRSDRMMELFLVQNKAVSVMGNWIGNFKLFFGLFQLGVKSFGVAVLVCMVGGMIVASRLGRGN